MKPTSEPEGFLLWCDEVAEHPRAATMSTDLAKKVVAAAVETALRSYYASEHQAVWERDRALERVHFLEETVRSLRAAVADLEREAQMSASLVHDLREGFVDGVSSIGSAIVPMAVAPLGTPPPYTNVPMHLSGFLLHTVCCPKAPEATNC